MDDDRLLGLFPLGLVVRPQRRRRCTSSGVTNSERLEGGEFGIVPATRTARECGTAVTVAA